MALKDSQRNLIIILCTTIPVIAVLLFAACLCHRSKKRSGRILKRGITPIADEEIESWRTEKDERLGGIGEKTQYTGDRKQKHHHKRSASSVQRPNNVVIYPNSNRPSEDLSPRSLHHYKASFDGEPQAPVLALAPNARPGLTDEMVQGDDAFVPKVKRNPSRLAKAPKHQHHRSAQSNFSIGSNRDHWYGQQQQQYTDATPSTRRSADAPRTPTSQRHGHARMYSSNSIHLRHSYDDDSSPGGLSPRPLIHKSDIGRAIG